jgi:translocator protein
MLKEWLTLLLIIAVTLIPSMAIAATTRDSISTWLPTLKKPKWNPPNWLFGPVWTVLYISMSVAVWLVWKEDPSSIWAFRLYVAQLVLNHVWSPVFFLLKRPGWAFGVIVALWCAIAVTAVSFFMVLPAAGKLMVPYLGWVSFAACLNYRIWRDNSGDDSGEILRAG